MSCFSFAQPHVLLVHGLFEALKILGHLGHLQPAIGLELLLFGDLLLQNGFQSGDGRIGFRRGIDRRLGLLQELFQFLVGGLLRRARAVLEGRQIPDHLLGRDKLPALARTQEGNRQQHQYQSCAQFHDALHVA